MQLETLKTESNESNGPIAELKSNETLYRQIINTTSEGYLLLDTLYVVKDTNAAFLKILGFDKEALLGRRQSSGRRALLSEKIGLELLHAGRGQQDRRVIGRDQGRGANHLMSLPLEVLEKF